MWRDDAQPSLPGLTRQSIADKDGETCICRAGESWSEPPGAIHSITGNASKTEPAKLLAVFVLDTSDNPLTTTIK
jgi:quercetin dioxygenase-like cupin family protein